jgi:hypothetical protein
VTEETWLQPPLTRELFDARFNQILRQYPLLHNAVPEIRQAMGDSAVSLEDFLRASYRDSSDPVHQRIFNAVPLYLQELLWRISGRWTERPDWYALLALQALRHFDRVVFVTLNYDTLLDSVLDSIDPLHSIDEFIRLDDKKRWALVKLHGSITWRKKILTSEGFNWAQPPLAIQTEERIQHSRDSGLDSFRYCEEGGSTVPAYPALSVPLGSEDDLNCPPEHSAFLLGQFQAADEVEMLVIGYSGLDMALLRHLDESGSSLGHLTVVDQGRRQAEEVANRIASQVRVLDGEAQHESFAAFARSGGLTGLLIRRGNAS